MVGILNKKFVSLKYKINEENFDVAYSVISDYEFTGVEEKNDELIITMDDLDYKKNLEFEIENKIKNLNIDIRFDNKEIINDKNWNEEYEKKSKPIIVNDRIAITPSWRVEEVNSDIKIIINPKMSFGTGEHSTTKLVCRLMDGLVEKDSKWTDVGTGTGVLAILAAKLGAQSVFAFDNNEWSVANAIENAELNKVNNIIDISKSDVDNAEIPKSEGIAANLFLHLVVKSFDKFYNSLINNDSNLIISGIMSHDKSIVIEKAEDSNYELIKTITEDEWIAFHFKPKGK